MSISLGRFNKLSFNGMVSYSGLVEETGSEATGRFSVGSELHDLLYVLT